MSHTSVDKSEKSRDTTYVWLSYVKWGMFSLFLSAIGIFFAHLINVYFPLTQTTIKILQLIGFLPLAASLGQRGYDIQTWGGKSPQEKLNKLIFVILSSIGFLLIVLTNYLE